MKKPKVFISRNLEPDSIFQKKLTAKGFDVQGVSLIHFESIEFSQIRDVDWIFFYSKKGIQFFFEGLKKIDANWQESMKKYQLATIGEASAAYLEKIYKKPDFAGNGEPKETATEFLKYAKGKRVLFPQATNSRQSIQKLLSDEITALSLVVYENQAAEGFAIANDFDILVFTSPLNVEIYFKERNYVSGQRIIAIGNTTAEALENVGMERIEIAKEPSEEGLIEIVLGT